MLHSLVVTLLERPPQWLVLSLGTWIAHELAWALCNLFYLFVAQYKLFERYRIQAPAPAVPMSQQWADFWQLLRGHCLILLPLIFAVTPIMLYTGFYSSAVLPTLRVFFVQQLVFNVIEDTGFYWIHRLMHHPELFKRFHYKHHLYTRPYSLSGGIAHPVEFVFNWLLPIVVGPLIMAWFQGVHVVSLWSWIAFRELRSTDAHSGYNLPFHPLRLLNPIYGGAVMHDHHHTVQGLKTNYGGYKVWDALCGTAAPSSTTGSTKRAQ